MPFHYIAPSPSTALVSRGWSLVQWTVSVFPSVVVGWNTATCYQQKFILSTCIFKNPLILSNLHRTLKVSYSQKGILVSSNLPKNEPNIRRISAPVSKKRSNHKSKGTLSHKIASNEGLISDIKDLYFLRTDLFLEARVEILTKTLLVIWYI